MISDEQLEYYFVTTEAIRTAMKNMRAHMPKIALLCDGLEDLIAEIRALRKIKDAAKACKSSFATENIEDVKYAFDLLNQAIAEY